MSNHHRQASQEAGYGASSDGEHCPTPAEFVRLRYFFGQRLGAVDLSDEQAYLVGKQRFHNLRAHGAGVLCGLRAERFVFPQGLAPEGQPTTVLRVSRGAALDALGREIVVGWDQCIDVAAWYQQKRKDKPAIDALWVALRYRECPSDPAPAPREACGCDAAGCDYTRIREGFELMLLTEEDAKACMVRPPSLGALKDLHAETALHGSAQAVLSHAVNEWVAEACASPSADACLLLARFRISLDAAGKKVVDIGPPDNSRRERLSLVPSAVLQEALMLLLGREMEAESFAEGPQIAGMRFESLTSHSGTLCVDINLAADGAPLCNPFAGGPRDVKVYVAFFGDDGPWQTVSTTNKISYVATPPHLEVHLDGLKPGRYRVVVENDHAQPAVDTHMRQLSPPRWARHFRLEKTTPGALVLAKTLY